MKNECYKCNAKGEYSCDEIGCMNNMCKDHTQYENGKYYCEDCAKKK